MTTQARIMLRPLGNPLPLGFLARDVVAGMPLGRRSTIDGAPGVRDQL